MHFSNLLDYSAIGIRFVSNTLTLTRHTDYTIDKVTLTTVTLNIGDSGVNATQDGYYNRRHCWLWMLISLYSNSAIEDVNAKGVAYIMIAMQLDLFGTFDALQFWTCGAKQ